MATRIIVFTILTTASAQPRNSALEDSSGYKTSFGELGLNPLNSNFEGKNFQREQEDNNPSQNGAQDRYTHQGTDVVPPPSPNTVQPESPESGGQLQSPESLGPILSSNTAMTSPPLQHGSTDIHNTELKLQSEKNVNIHKTQQETNTNVHQNTNTNTNSVNLGDNGQNNVYHVNINYNYARKAVIGNRSNNTGAKEFPENGTNEDAFMGRSLVLTNDTVGVSGYLSNDTIGQLAVRKNGAEEESGYPANGVTGSDVIPGNAAEFKLPVTELKGIQGIKRSFTDLGLNPLHSKFEDRNFKRDQIHEQMYANVPNGRNLPNQQAETVGRSAGPANHDSSRSVTPVKKSVDRSAANLKSPVIELKGIQGIKHSFSDLGLNPLDSKFEERNFQREQIHELMSVNIPNGGNLPYQQTEAVGRSAGLANHDTSRSITPVKESADRSATDLKSPVTELKGIQGIRRSFTDLGLNPLDSNFEERNFQKEQIHEQMSENVPNGGILLNQQAETVGRSAGPANHESSQSMTPVKESADRSAADLKSPVVELKGIQGIRRSFTDLGLNPLDSKFDERNFQREQIHEQMSVKVPNGGNLPHQHADTVGRSAGPANHDSSRSITPVKESADRSKTDLKSPVIELKGIQGIIRSFTDLGLNPLDSNFEEKNFQRTQNHEQMSVNMLKGGDHPNQQAETVGRSTGPDSNRSIFPAKASMDRSALQSNNVVFKTAFPENKAERSSVIQASDAFAKSAFSEVDANGKPIFPVNEANGRSAHSANGANGRLLYPSNDATGKHEFHSNNDRDTRTFSPSGNAMLPTVPQVQVVIHNNMHNPGASLHNDHNRDESVNRATSMNINSDVLAATLPNRGKPIRINRANAISTPVHSVPGHTPEGGSSFSIVQESRSVFTSRLISSDQSVKGATIGRIDNRMITSRKSTLGHDNVMQLHSNIQRAHEDYFNAVRDRLIRIAGIPHTLMGKK